MNQDLLRTDPTRDPMIVAAAFVFTLAGILFGWGSAVVALGALAIPLAGLVVGRWFSGRGAVVGCGGLALGSTLIRPTPCVVPWRELAVLGPVPAFALLAG